LELGDSFAVPATKTRDVMDASVVLCAQERGYHIVTSDPNELRWLDALPAPDRRVAGFLATAAGAGRREARAIPQRERAAKGN
jgi:hypothetical protein